MPGDIVRCYGTLLMMIPLDCPSLAYGWPHRSRDPAGPDADRARRWGIRHRTTTPRLRVRAELLANGGPKMRAQFMDELREIHLGHAARPATRPRVTERLARAHASLSSD
jgi:hypothetical protein